MWLTILIIIDNIVFLALFLWYRRQYRRKLEEVRYLITRDPLTKLYNRRGFDDMLEQIRHMSIRSRESFAVLMIDVDHFKTINDTYGHSVGDAVLQTIGVLIEQECRMSDVVARIGGEEFAVILPNTGKDGAFVIAERIRQRISTYKSKLYPDLQMTVSIGIGLSDAGGGIMDNADKKLYIAKNTGRNKIVG